MNRMVVTWKFKTSMELIEEYRKKCVTGSFLSTRLNSRQEIEDVFEVTIGHCTINATPGYYSKHMVKLEFCNEEST